MHNTIIVIIAYTQMLHKYMLGFIDIVCNHGLLTHGRGSTLPLHFLQSHLATFLDTTRMVASGNPIEFI